jgi:hypothetical protein
MKRILLALLVPLVISATAVAGPNPASANAHCKNLMRKSPAMFGPNAGQYADLAACVAAKSAQAAKNTTNAAKTCKAEQAADAKAFAEKYGPTTGNGKSNGKSEKSNNGKAMGACVSATAKASTQEQQKAELNAAKTCKAERADANFSAGHGGKTFNVFYGKNKNLKNAFGKCVSAHAKAMHS